MASASKFSYHSRVALLHCDACVAMLHTPNLWGCMWSAYITCHTTHPMFLTLLHSHSIRLLILTLMCLSCFKTDYSIIRAIYYNMFVASKCNTKLGYTYFSCHSLTVIVIIVENRHKTSFTEVFLMFFCVQ